MYVRNIHGIVRGEKGVVFEDKFRPVTASPLTGTPWCVVRTGYNYKLSVWGKQAEMVRTSDDVVESSFC